MKKKSVKDAVLACVRKSGPIKAGDVIRETGRPASQVYVMLHRLLRDGVLDRLGQEYVINGPDMTAIKPKLPIAIDKTTNLTEEQLNNLSMKVTRRKATGMEMHLGQKTSKLEKEIADLQKKLQDTTIKYFDAMAVIKYLESKVIAQFGK